MLRRVFLALTCLFAFGATAQAASDDMLDLPVNPATTSLTYLYCLTNDQAAATDLLQQRFKYIGETEKNARALAGDWVKNGYCAQFLADFAKIAPNLRSRVVKELKEAGFSPRKPITEQMAEADDPETQSSKLGKILKGIGRALGKLFGGGGGSYERSQSYMKFTAADGSSTEICDKSTTINVGGGGGDIFKPGTPPFMPDPKP